jgi:phage terminase large subunit
LGPFLEILFPAKLEFLRYPARYKVAWGGRGGTKSWGFARQLLLDGYDQPLVNLCTREIQQSIDESVHRLLAAQVSELGLDGFYTVQKNTIIGRNGTEFIFAGLREQNVHKIKSYEGVDRVWVEEAQVVTKRSWDILIPTIRKAGSEIWISFNPELDTDETYQRFVVNPPAGAIVVKIGWQDNPWFPKELKAAREDCLKRDPDGYENIWEGKPRTVVEGAIYKNEIIALFEQKRVRDVPYDPALLVHTVWDLGFVRMPVILVQRVGSALSVLEYIENEDADYASVVAELKKRPYNWGHDWLPHDAQSNSPHTGKTPEAIVRGLGRSVRITPKLSIEDGIKLARTIFPRCYFDKDKCALLINRLKRYRRVVPIGTQEPGAPLHDENSDGADAFRYLAIVADKLRNEDLMTRKLEYSNAGIV